MSTRQKTSSQPEGAASAQDLAPSVAGTGEQNGPAHADTEKLVREFRAELSRVASLLSSEITPAVNSTGSVLVGRMVQGLSKEQWETLAHDNNLASWIAIPLHAEASVSMGSITAMLDQLVYQRDHDALTGLANRRYFDNYIEIELKRARRNNTPLSLVLLDLDDFKRINDSMGHQCGDKVLREIGGFLQAGHRSFEMVARIGGDEFAIVLPGSNCWVTRNMLERVCSDIAAHAIRCDDSPEFNVNFSAGVASVGPDTGYTSPDELFKRADAALYDAKRKGKNQVCIMAEAQGRSPSDCMVLSHEKKFLFTTPE
ncbi:GGDEF domain-containing protein [Desulfovibrio sp. OttesenSCG-928-C06]|nr:GGDEF domain-containing protein [Desulfovibrio sp. OttesenSCG-928-C06]